MIVFITGGAKNGKSSLAQDIAVRLSGGGTHYYLATMIPADAEDRERIRLHVEDRAGMGFETVECGRHILSVLDKTDASGTYLLDSATALLMNELFDPTDWHLDIPGGERCGEEIAELAERVANIVIVSDYLYSDAARYDEVTLAFQRCLARIDRKLAAKADVVMELSAGNVYFHKGVLNL